jgi:hypothetical protein
MRRRIALKRRVLCLAALLMLVVMSGMVPTALADDDDDDDGGRGSATLVDFTSGRGTANFGVGVPSTFDFNVTSGPTGVAGSATLTSAFGVPFSGPATCLRVVGNLAVFEVDSQPPADPRDVVVFVGDFGVLGKPQRDSFNFDFVDGIADADCPGVSERERSVVTGDIVVGDDQPARRGNEDDDEDDDD